MSSESWFPGWVKETLVAELSRATWAENWIEEQRRQQDLEHALGQPLCDASTEAHDIENLPCAYCGAAI
jgi:hypothetical protein